LRGSALISDKFISPSNSSSISPITALMEEEEKERERGRGLSEVTSNEQVKNRNNHRCVHP